MVPTRKGVTATLLAAGIVIAGTVFAVLNAGQATARQAPAAPAPTWATASPIPAYLLRCSAPSTNVFGLTPPLTLVSQPTAIQRTTVYRNCQAPALPNIRSGYEHLHFNIMDDCALMVQGSGQSSYVITWNTNQSSTFTGTRNAVLSGNTLTVSFNGSITAGLYAGRRARQVFTGDATELVACLAGTGTQVPFIISDVSFVIYP